MCLNLFELINAFLFGLLTSFDQPLFLPRLGLLNLAGPQFFISVQLVGGMLKLIYELVHFHLYLVYFNVQFVDGVGLLLQLFPVRDELLLVVLLLLVGML